MSRLPMMLAPPFQQTPAIAQGRPGMGATATQMPSLRPTAKPTPGPNAQRPGSLARGGSVTRGPAAQASIGAEAPASAPTGIYSGAGGTNPVSFINSLLGGQPSSGFSFNIGQGQSNIGTNQPPSAQQRAMNYLGGGGAVSTSNPVAPGSWWGAANSPTQAGQLGAWQNNQAIQQTAQAFGARDGMLQNDYWDLGNYAAPGYTDGGFADAMRYLGGGGAVSTSNPVTPGSVHNGGIGGPEQAAALGAWQNQQNIAQTMQAFGGGRGPQMANSDYAPGGSMYRPPPPAPAAQAAAPASGGSGGGGTGGAPNTSGLTQPMGGGGNLAPVYSTINGQGQIFDDGQTQRNINQQVEAIKTHGDLRGNMKRFSRPGMSMDAGTAAAAAPAVGQAAADAAAAQASGGLQDQLANSTYQLSGQEAQGEESLALANLLRRLQQAGDYQQSAYTSSILGPVLQGLLSSI